jgi:hypothetical protein
MNHWAGRELMRDHRYKRVAPQAQRADEFLEAILKRCRPPCGRELEALRLAWTECVAPRYTTHCRITSFSRGKLRVEVSSAAVLAELAGFLKQDILKCLRQKRPDINLAGLQLVQVG